MRRLAVIVVSGCLLVAGLGTFSPASATASVFGRLVDGVAAGHPAAPGMTVKLRTVTGGGPGTVVDTDVTDSSGAFQLNPGSSTDDEFYVQVMPGNWQGGYVGSNGGGADVVQPTASAARTYGPGNHIGSIWANPAYIRGVVVDAATGHPVSGIYVTARDANDDLAVEGSDTTDSNGVFRVTGITCEDSCYLKLNGTGRSYEVGFRGCHGIVVATWGEACASPIGRIGKVRLHHL